MASPPLPEPGAELRALQGKVEALEAELGSCRSQLEQVQRLLRHTERLYREAQESNEALQTQVEELSKEVHDRKKTETASVEVQTEDDASWHQSDYYYYQNYCNNIDHRGDTSELSVQQNHENEGLDPNSSSEQAQAGADIDSYMSSTELAECGQGDNLIENLQEAEDTSLAEGTLAESLRAAAEAAVSQTGFIYDETTGLYYDHSTGFYYNSENQLYYDPATGIYYYCDVESGRYQFHSRVDLQSYQASTTQQNKDKKGKKKRKDAEWIAANEHKDLDTEEQKSPRSLNCLFTTNEQLSSTEEEESPNARKKAKVDIDVRNRLPAKEAIITDSIKLHPNRKTEDPAFMDDSKIIETESEPEEGEITDSECEEYTSEDEVTSEESNINSEDSEDEERIWPPCIRVIVIRSPVLQTGSLYIITAVKAATVGREKDMEHTLQIPEVGVSKFHAEIYFDHELQNYVLVDQGSQNGTIVNGNQILQPKIKCDPYVLEHGDEVKIGETVLSFHIHPGSDTCDGCEPGQVRAHLRLDKKKESSACPALSKEERELVRRKELKKIRVKYGLQNTAYEDDKAVKNPNYKDRAGKRRETIGSEGTFQRDDAPASVHVEISDCNKGHKMLEKMGWKKGEGLGKDGGGMKNPIQLHIHKTHAGLGTSRPASVDDVQVIKSKNKKNWDKARERFAESFQEAKTKKDAPKIMPWVKGTAE